MTRRAMSTAPQPRTRHTLARIPRRPVTVQNRQGGRRPLPRQHRGHTYPGREGGDRGCGERRVLFLDRVTSTAIATARNYRVLSGCTPTQADVDALSLTSTSWVYVKCDNPGFKGSVTIPGKRIVFSDQINSSAQVVLPDAAEVSVFGGGGGIDASGGFSMHHHRSARRVRQLHKRGQRESCHALRQRWRHHRHRWRAPALQHDRVHDGRPGRRLRHLGDRLHCRPRPRHLPQAPCTSLDGRGQIAAQTGGGIHDWTAPNRWDDMTLATGTRRRPRHRGRYATGPEDLALWDETVRATAPNYQMAGAAPVHLSGHLHAAQRGPDRVQRRRRCFDLSRRAVHRNQPRRSTGGAQLCMTRGPEQRHHAAEARPRSAGALSRQGRRARSAAPIMPALLPSSAARTSSSGR